MKQREEEAAQRIISEDFADKTDIEKDAMRSVLAKGMEDVGKSWREAKEEAVNAWMDMLGNHEHVETIQRKQKEGGSEVSVIDFVEEGGQYETKRVSGNEGWYRDAFKKEGKMPSQRSIMDYDHNETVREMEAGGATKEDIDALNRYREKVEALEGLEDYVKTLDNKHLTAKILLNKDTFDKVYTPFVEELEKGNEQVKKAAKDSALILSKMAETLSRAYGVPVEDIAASLRVNDGKVSGYGQAMYRSKENTLSEFVEKVMKEPEVIGKAYYRVGSGDNTIDISYNAVQHVQNGNHPLTRGEWEDFANNIGKISEVYKSKRSTSKEEIPILIKIKTPNNTFGAVLKFTQSGRVFLTTAFANTEKGIDAWIQQNKSSRVHPASIPGSSGQLLENSQTLQNRSSSKAGDFSISTIQKELGIVKKKEYRQTASEAKLTRDEAAFSHNVDLFMNGELKGGNVKVMTTPLVMKLVGAEILPVYIHQNILAKILKHGKKVDGIHGHADEMDADTLKQLPKALTDPMAIVESKGKPVVITSLVDKNGDEVVVPFLLSVEVGARRKYTANIIQSAYGKGSKGWIASQIAKNAKYINRKRTEAWFQSAGLQLPIEETNPSVLFGKFTVPNETDLVKLKNENPEYYQQKEEYAGAYEAENNAIHIFSAGNESTAVHEGAHFFLSTLEKLSQDTTIPEDARGKIEEDLSVIRNWASYRPEVMKEYRGTALSKEFREYEKAIKENPDDESAKERFMQERFARGFERYLLTGKAPSKELQGAFRRFKSWLTNLYRSAMNLGKADAPEEMRHIFDKMVATEEEIEAWGEEVKARSLAEDINKLNKAVDTEKSEAGNIKEWLENIKESTKEKALSHFMKQYKGELLTQFDTAAEEKGETGSRDFLFGEQERLCLIKEFYGKIINMDIPVGYERIYYADTMVSRPYGKN